MVKFDPAIKFTIICSYKRGLSRYIKSNYTSNYSISYL